VDRDPVLETTMKIFGLAALGCYAIHAGFHILNGRPEEVLWMCHLGAALVGAGLLSSSATTNGIGTLFLCVGMPLWVMYLAGGGEFYPTSCFPHLGGLAIGLYVSAGWGYRPAHGGRPCWHWQL
jgi:predicted membrane channel-forming protein YqfA (hemolysin III family)